MTRIDRKTKVLSLILVLTILFCAISIIWFKHRPILEVRAYCPNELVLDYLSQNTKTIKTDKTLLEIRYEISRDFDFGNYIYKGSNVIMNGYKAGYCQLLINYIVVYENQSKENYAWTFAHELMHLKLFNRNETLTEFETFKALYNSENEFLRQVAINKGYSYLLEPRQNAEYEISGYIADYILLNF